MPVDDLDVHFGSPAGVRAVAECRWLDAALRARGLALAADSEQRLPGGCHSIVMRGALQQAGRGDAIVKWISGDASVLERTWLRLQLGLDRVQDKRVQLLRSFMVEASFYRGLGVEVAGLRVPRASFVHSDPWRQRFATVMEAVPARVLEAEHPGGFSAAATGACLRRLAEFHAAQWSRPTPPGVDLWPRGSYWCGDKRLAFKRQFPARWSQACAGLELDPVHADLGRLLAPRLDTILAAVQALPGRTLIHGDFKVTNIFPDLAGDDPDGEVWTIDWQWLGRGSPVIDSVYFLLTSVRAELLTKERVEDLIRREHHAVLLRHGVTGYTFEDLWSEWRWVALDFFLYVVTCKWHRMTRADAAGYAAAGKDGFHLRSVEHMERIVTLAREFAVDLGLIADQ